jgi:exonuclease SbcC
LFSVPSAFCPSPALLRREDAPYVGFLFRCYSTPQFADLVLQRAILAGRNRLAAGVGCGQGATRRLPAPTKSPVVCHPVQAREHAASELASEKALSEAASTRLTKATAAVRDLRDALNAPLAESGLALDVVEAVVAAGQEALTSETEALAQLETALRETAAVLAKCRTDLVDHEGSEQPAVLGTALAEAIAAVKVELSAATERKNDTALAVKQDDQVRLRTAQLRSALESEDAANDIWLKLAVSIGDKEGNVFRRFAQGLTLGRLLEHANSRLADLKPRYTLERGVGGDMLIQVVDNDMGGEVRGLQNLSGGERFLVSLALALGLAEMSTASGVRIESLFIDEGFGVLDPASLGQAIALLEHLQASGRRVGVISHVEELKERTTALAASVGDPERFKSGRQFAAWLGLTPR